MGQVPGAPSTSSAGTGRGWRSRGYLPHFDDEYLLQSITFRLHDSLPKAVVERLTRDLATQPIEKRADEKRRRIDALIDSGHGCCVLRHPAVAKMLEDGLLLGDRVKYRLLAWVIMPNHVHVLIHPLPGISLGKIVQSWKSFSARWINSHALQLGLTAPLEPVWQREYWDRFIRDEAHYLWTKSYIHDNPVKAGLVGDCHQWRWSSAWAEAGE